MPLLSELLFTLFAFGWMSIFTCQLFACSTRKLSSREERKEQSRMKPTSRRSAQSRNHSRKKSVSKSNIRRDSKKDAGKEKKEAGDGEKKAEKNDDSFEDRVPVTRECKRAQEEPQIAKKTKDNKGDYKTWNKVIENEDFDAPLSDPNSKPVVKKANAQAAEKTATLGKDDKTKK